MRERHSRSIDYSRRSAVSAGSESGLGLRRRDVGLRAEYARFGRFAGEGMGSGLPESDQVSVGVQFRF
jgi:hypothetical protein